MAAFIQSLLQCMLLCELLLLWNITFVRPIHHVPVPPPYLVGSGGSQLGFVSELGLQNQTITESLDLLRSCTRVIGAKQQWSREMRPRGAQFHLQSNHAPSCEL